MIWAGIIGDRLVGLIKVPEGVKVTSAAYCNLLNESLVPWLDVLPLSLLRDFVFLHDNAPSHSARATQAFLATLGIQDEKLMIWPPSSSDSNKTEIFLAIIKRDIYSDGRKFSSKESLWQAINTAARAVSRAAIKKLTDSMNTRLFDVTKGHCRHVGK